MTTKTDKAESLDYLRGFLTPGTTVYTTLKSVSRSGMSRKISVHVIRDSRILDITWHVANVTGFKQDRDTGALKVGGAGMDMGFHVVYSLSRAVFPGGHKCTGSNGYVQKRNGGGSSTKHSKAPRCPSNDHSNDYGMLCREYDAAHPEQMEERGVIGSQYVSDRQNWVRSKKTYTKTRMHRDGGYALPQAWL